MAHHTRLGRKCAAFLLAASISGCSGGTALTPTQTPAQRSPSASSVQQYRLVGLSSLGGGFAAGISDNEQGWISGYSLLSDNATLHAALWYPMSTSPKDLGTLGGANSAVEWPNHTPNQVVGISQLAQTDPLGEQWSCTYPAGFGFLPYTGQECRGFVWSQDEGMTQLGTLGGNNSFATGSNASGQIVGWAETNTHDATCVLPQVLGFRAVMWDRSGHANALAPYGQDPDSAATAINDRGDVAGISGICQNAVGALSAMHMILWKNGVPTSLGTLGGSAWNTPMMLNDRDEVVGFSDRSGDNNGSNFNAHAFLWKDGVLTDLGTLAGDAVSYAYSINNRGLIVGQSCTSGCASSRAFLYQNGVMYDLNTLLDSSSAGYDLIFANDINDEGEITGLAVNRTNQSIIGFRLVPSGALSLSTVRAASVPRAGLSTYRMHVGPFGHFVP